MRDQRDANEQLLLSSMRAQEDADQAEAARAVAETERARLFEHAGWGVAIISDQDNRFVSVNPAFASMHGYFGQELLGCGLEKVCPPAARTQLVEDIRLLHEKGHHLFEGTHVRKDGSQFPCLTEATVSKDREGKLAGSAYNFQDVTERTQLKARLAVADRLAALGTMSAGIAHEINNPLAYNLANICHVRSELPGLLHDFERLVSEGSSEWPGIQQRTEGLLSALKDAQEGAERIERIVAAMKTFARPLDEGFKVADLPRMLEAAIRICHDQCTQRATVVQDFRKAPPVHCNDGQLGQVFVNLLVNATQSIEPGFPEKNEIRIVLDTDRNGDALIEVVDTGCGIAPESIHEIYDPFFTTKPIGVGSGLGLSISHSIIAAHGGQITVESVVGKGTTFRTCLPSAKVPRQPEDRKPVEASTLRRKAKILVIDDEDSVGRALRRTLDKHHEVVTLNSAQSAVALLEDGACFDVIFCDLMMPEMTGMEFYEWVAVNRSQLAERLLFVTGGAVSASSRDFIDRMADRVVLKPFERGRIAEIVEKLLERCEPAGL